METLSVKEFLEKINILLQELGVFKIQGEIQQKKILNRGYEFFELKDPKDERYLLECYISGSILRLHRHLIRDGMEVVVWGVPQIYRTGSFRLVIIKIEPIGKGALRQAFEALKAELQKKGYFNPERKRNLPIYFEKIGLITSEGSDGYYDFLAHLGNYGFKIFFLDTKVEGENASSQIVRAINWFNLNMPDLDLIALVRGGGGQENLKAFNTKEVAEAIFTSKLKIVTGIGHKKDETIAGLVADIDLATPSIAGEFLKKCRQDLINQVKNLESQMVENMLENLEKEKNQLNFLLEHLIFNLNSIFKEIKFWLKKLIELTEQKFQIYEYQFKILYSRLKILDPRALLSKGYSITLNSSGQVIKSSKQVQIQERLSTILKEGKIFSMVQSVENDQEQ